MKELQEIVSAWDTLCAEGREAVLATVVGVSGSTYRRPGARMLLAGEGRLAGSVSGGCLEADLVKKAHWHTRNGAALVTYDSTDEDDVVWGFGLGCNGVVQVLLERVSSEAPGPLRLLQSVLQDRRPGVIATVIGGNATGNIGQRFLLMPDGRQEGTLGGGVLLAQVEKDAQAVLAARQSRTDAYALPGGTSAIVFLEAVLPPLPLVIFGANHDALPLVRLAKELGWHVTVADVRGAQPRPERFPGADTVLAGSAEVLCREIRWDAQTAAVVMTHNYPDDRRVLRRLLETSVSYIGQLGPKVRTERLLAEISDGGSITDSHRLRLHGPVGLDLGADTPEQIALSIVAEIQAARTGRSGESLRSRREPLHPHPAALAMPGQLQEQARCAVLT